MVIMKLNVLKSLSFAIVVLFGLHCAYGSSRTHHTLKWQEPTFFPVNEDGYIEIMYFDDAIYGDIKPEVPMFHKRIKLTVPFFSYKPSLDHKEIIPVLEREDELLRKASFFEEEIRLHQSVQSSRKEKYAVISFFPFIYDVDSDTYHKLASFELSLERFYDPEISYASGLTYADNSVLATGDWFRFCLEETGIYRLTYNDLEGLGMNPSSIQKQNIRIYGNGGGTIPDANSEYAPRDLLENAIYISGSSTGTFGQNDYILFYGESPDIWYFDGDDHFFRYERHLYATENCYFITADLGPGKRIEQQESIAEEPTHQINEFRNRAVHQKDLRNLLESGRIWFGEVFDAGPAQQFTFDIENLIPNRQAVVEAYVAARAPVPSRFTLQAGGSQMEIPISAFNPTDYNTDFAHYNVTSMTFQTGTQTPLTINLSYNRPVSGARGWLNYLIVNAASSLSFSGPQFSFRDVDHLGPENILQFDLSNAGSNVQIWDVTDRFNIRNQQTTQSGNSQLFRVSGENPREFIAFDGSEYLSVNIEGLVPNQNLHGMSVKDMFIVAHEDFLDEAERLADFRRTYSDLTVAVITTQQVYNEFSSGSPDAGAIRNFMKMFYDRAVSPEELPRYLLLFGNGSFDNKDILGYGANFIPTFQSTNSLAPRFSYITDDFFGLLDDHEGEEAFGIVDLGIGRLPARTPEDAEILVDKIIRYEKRIPGMAPGATSPEYSGVISNYADWRNLVVFVADDGDNNTHFNHAEQLTGILANNKPSYNIRKIYLDAYQQVTMAGGARYPEVNRAINESVNQGALMINYIGHGGPRGLAQQRILTFEDIVKWNNMYNMPVFMTATCEFTNFDQPDPEQLSAGERILLRPDGGSAALFTTTRLAWSGQNLTLNRSFMNAAFPEHSTNPAQTGNRMGDLIRLAKQNSSAGGTTPRQLRNFVLLGDPSMLMGYPKYRVVTENMPDTIRAFQEVEVSGYIVDMNGNRVENYNGFLYPTIYDKKSVFRTLGNNTGSHPADFYMRQSVLYKGQVSVVDGSFSFLFMVPKDIAYSYGEGKISYYLDDGQTDGHGYFTDFTIGGTLDEFELDNEGPDIRLFMNDTTFISGDQTHENPILLALLSDESGINVTGSIGRDIIAYLNGNISDPIRLNNYFEADLDTYQSGRVLYPFRRLEEGRHTLTLRAWDTHNNPSEATIEFVVSSMEQLILEHLVNYPNPFSDQTRFVFKHNQAGSDMDIRIEIFDLQGRLVRTIEERVFSSGFQSTPILWDGTGNDGSLLGNGLYIYRVTMKTPEGNRARQSERLIIFR